MCDEYALPTECGHKHTHTRHIWPWALWRSPSITPCWIQSRSRAPGSSTHWYANRWWCWCDAGEISKRYPFSLPILGWVTFSVIVFLRLFSTSSSSPCSRDVSFACVRNSISHSVCLTFSHRTFFCCCPHSFRHLFWFRAVFLFVALFCASFAGEIWLSTMNEIEISFQFSAGSREWKCEWVSRRESKEFGVDFSFARHVPSPSSSRFRSFLSIRCVFLPPVFFLLSTKQFQWNWFDAPWNDRKVCCKWAY